MTTRAQSPFLFKLCGTELVCGTEYYQEWWIRLVDKGTV
jgi:hypothetical protein